ncbi:MAG: PKD domain-containing protein, partial [Ferruginibacter sp.]
MKKIFTLLWLSIITAFAFNAAAQGTTCNAEYNYQYLSNNTVKFNPQETQGPPLVTHTWNFGDGSPVSNLVSPTHVFAASGNYPVVHTIVRVNQNNTPVCTGTFTKVVNITICDLVVDFSWTSTAANPLVVAFQNLSVPLSNTDSVTWQFGDNTTSHAVNPVHTYAVAGTYNVCLIVKKFPTPTSGQCIKYICKTVVVTTPCNLVANFNWTVTQTNPLSIEFHNLSVPLSTTDSITWTFGDGGTSNAVNPVHTYANAGTYTVCLRVKKLTPPGAPPCIREICKTLVIPPPCNLVVDFSSTIATSNPLMVYFQNLSVPLSNTDSITWTFGDGQSANTVNAVHTYANAGTYTVCLRVKKLTPPGTTPCVREICKTIVIPPACNLVVDFNWTVTPNNPLRIEFHNLTNPIAATDSIRWTFGDGTSSNQIHPVHTYTAPGTYTVCLRIIRYNGTNTPCIREICKTIVIPVPCNLVVSFTSEPVPNQPLSIRFTNTSTPGHASDSLRWTFGDGTSLSGVQSDPNVASPIHHYANAGTFTVCLRVKKNNI